MRTDQLDALVSSYLVDQARSVSPSAQERAAYTGVPFGIVSDLLMDASGEGAEVAWDLIVRLIDRAPSEEVMLTIAAGPLEDLVIDFSERFEERVVARARNNARFRRALAEVWGWENVGPSFRDAVAALVRRAPLEEDG